MSSSSRSRPLQRVGHKGADTAVPGNTRASFDAALRYGVDMIEFDVLRLGDGRIVVAHDLADAATRSSLSLQEALDLFAEEAYAGVELDVDLKRPGYEREVVEALRERGLLERSLVSSTYAQTLDRVGELAPGLRRGWSLPRAGRDWTTVPLVALAALAYLRLVRLWLPGASARKLRSGRCDAVMAHHLLVGERLVAAVRRHGGLLYAWTVDDEELIESLDALGVDGVITNDPRLFPARQARRDAA